MIINENGVVTLTLSDQRETGLLDPPKLNEIGLSQTKTLAELAFENYEEKRINAVTKEDHAVAAQLGLKAIRLSTLANRMEQRINPE